MFPEEVQETFTPANIQVFCATVITMRHHLNPIRRAKQHQIADLPGTICRNQVPILTAGTCGKVVQGRICFPLDNQRNGGSNRVTVVHAYGSEPDKSREVRSDQGERFRGKYLLAPEILINVPGTPCKLNDKITRPFSTPVPVVNLQWFVSWSSVRGMGASNLDVADVSRRDGEGRGVLSIVCAWWCSFRVGYGNGTVEWREGFVFVLWGFSSQDGRLFIPLEPVAQRVLQTKVHLLKSQH